MADTEGQWSEKKPATIEIVYVACLVQNAARDLIKKTYDRFEATEYREIANQLPISYFIKVYVGENKYIHLMVRLEYVNILQPLKLVLIGLQENHKEDDPLDPFILNFQCQGTGIYSA